MRKTLLISLATFACWQAPASATDYAVIVNAANAEGGASADLVKNIRRLFLKEQTSWSNGTAARPLARAADSTEQHAFDSAVLGMGDAEINAHWAKVKQTKGETPPREVGSTSILLRLIEKDPGSFGVVTAEDASAAMELGDGIKILTTFSAP